MKDQSFYKVRLGIFVLIAVAFLVAGLYFIGSKKNFFGKAINVSANFDNVGGLLRGNNVRFNGINVGTVTKVYAISDTAIKVEFTIDEKAVPYILKNAIASIGTDGLLGNKLINIGPGPGTAAPVEEGAVMKTINPVSTDAELRTLAVTNDNLRQITDDLKNISGKLNAQNSLWNLLADTVMADNVRQAIVRLRVTGDNTAIVTGDLKKIVAGVRAGKGTIGALVTDTTLSGQLRQTIVNIHAISDSVVVISGNFKNISEKMKNGQGTVGALLTDTMVVHNLNQSIENIRKGAGTFNEDMEALKHSWPFKKYFRQQKKNSAKK